ncbi:MAG: hypothetical protein GQE15_39445 [Archangiaceae bacterium]|nr:hypothetical protein [Archangiaceae bacterium]
MRLAVFSILLLTAATARAKCVSPSTLSARGDVEPPGLACSSTSPVLSALGLLVAVAVRRSRS